MAKSTEKAAVKKASPKKVTAVKKEKSMDIASAGVTALSKLKELGIEQSLQADLEWCLGSYKFDKNPAGLQEMVGRAIKVFTVEKEKKTKGVTSKLITDLSKTL